MSFRSHDDRRFRWFLLLSLFVHVCILFLVAFVPKEQIEIKTREVTTRVQLKTSSVIQKTPPTPKPKKNVAAQAPVTKRPDTPEIPPEQEQINQMHNADVNASSNQTEKTATKVLAGKRTTEEDKYYQPEKGWKPEDISLTTVDEQNGVQEGSPSEETSRSEQEVPVTDRRPEAQGERNQPDEPGQSESQGGASPGKMADNSAGGDKVTQRKESIREQLTTEGASTHSISERTVGGETAQGDVSEQVQGESQERGGDGSPMTGTDGTAFKDAGNENRRGALQGGPRQRDEKRGVRIPKKFLDKYGNLEILDDGELSKTLVEDPLTEIESRTIKLVNRYLERMTRQVEAHYQKPQKDLKNLRGIIRFQLTPEGFLKDAWIFVGSGDRDLDQAALTAIRSVPRYSVPPNRIIAERYYSQLNFYYNSEDIGVEQAPWEDEEKSDEPSD